MAVISIPDVHGSHHWERIREKNDKGENPYDGKISIVFHGDYYDAWVNNPADQIRNFFEICRFKEEHPESVHILWGNHDWSYVTPRADGHRVSGHQWQVAQDIGEALKSQAHLMELSFTDPEDGTVYSHAGFTKTWLANVKEMTGTDNLEKLNALMRELKLPAELLDWHSDPSDRFYMADPTGDDEFQGPLWVRPYSLLKDSAFKKQVVGHTEVFRVPIALIDSTENVKEGEPIPAHEHEIVCVDSPDHKAPDFSLLRTYTWFQYMKEEQAAQVLIMKAKKEHGPIPKWLKAYAKEIFDYDGQSEEDL